MVLDRATAKRRLQGYYRLFGSDNAVTLAAYPLSDFQLEISGQSIR